MKRIWCGLLSLIMLFSVNMVTASAAGRPAVEYGSIKYTLAVEEEKSGAIPVRIENSHVYADAEFLGALLGFNTWANKQFIIFRNLDQVKNIVFTIGSTEVTTVSYLGGSLHYTAPFESVSEDSRLWVPMEFAFYMLDSGMIIAGDELLVTASCETVLSAVYKVHLNQQKYDFDWGDDFGYSDEIQKALGATGYLTTLLNGLLHLDSESAFQFVLQFFGISEVYDNKYTEEIAELFALNSNDEFNALSDHISAVNKVLSPDGKLAQLLDLTNHGLESNASRFTNQFIQLLKDQNTPNIQLDKAFNQMTNAIDMQQGFLKNKKFVNQFQEAFSKDTNNMFKFAGKAMEAIQYTSEFCNQDLFAVKALKTYCDNGMKADYIPSQAGDTFRHLVKGLEGSVVEYTVGNYLSDIMLDLLEQEILKPIKNQIGTKVSGALLLWDIASNTIPFLKNGLTSADKFVLASYAQIFQCDSYNTLFNISGSGTFDESSLCETSQAYYTYLKFCYIARQAAIATLDHKAVDKSALNFLKKYQEDINKEIVGLLAVFKSAQDNKKSKADNNNRAYGFLPSDNMEYLKNYSDEKLLDLVGKNNDVTSRLGNRMSNLLNGGDAVYDALNKKHYYVMNSSQLYCYDEQSNKDYLVLESKEGMRNLNLVDGTLYYTNCNGDVYSTIYKTRLDGLSTQSLKTNLEIWTLFAVNDTLYFNAGQKLYSLNSQFQGTPKCLIQNLSSTAGIFNYYNNAIVYLSELTTEQNHFTLSQYNLDTSKTEVLVSNVGCGNIKDPIYEHQCVVFEIIDDVLYVSPAGQRGETVINRFDLKKQKLLSPFKISGIQTQANIFKDQLVCWSEDGIGLIDVNTNHFTNLYHDSIAYLSYTYVIGEYIYIQDPETFFRFKKDGSNYKNLSDREEVFKTSLKQITTDEILQFIYKDFDSDGMIEAYAVTGKKEESMNAFMQEDNQWFTDCKIWGMSVESIAYGLSPQKENLYGKIPEPIETGDGQIFFRFEKDGGGSGSLTYLFYFDSSGFFKESSLSEKYMNFHQEENGKYIAYSHSFLPEGGHHYIPHEFRYDQSSGDFILVK